MQRKEGYEYPYPKNYQMGNQNPTAIPTDDPIKAAVGLKNQIDLTKQNYHIKMQKFKKNVAKALIPVSLISGIILGTYVGFKYAKRHYRILPGTKPPKGLMRYFRRQKAAAPVVSMPVVQQVRQPVIATQQTVINPSVLPGERLVASQRIPVERVREYETVTRQRVPYHEVRELYEGPAQVIVTEVPAREYLARTGSPNVRPINNNRTLPTITNTNLPTSALSTRAVRPPFTQRLRESAANLL